MRQAIGIDLGCTNIKAVVVDTSGNILEQSRQETHEQDDSRWKGTVKTIIKDFKNKFRAVDRIGLCAPGYAYWHQLSYGRSGRPFDPCPDKDCLR